tara:strand:- start:5747 stop:6574 length:828 start_codon:yes stop_codon:yes gene_type:complete
MILKKIKKLRHFISSQFFEFSTLKHLKSKGQMASLIAEAYSKAKYHKHAPNDVKILTQLASYREELRRDNQTVSFQEVGSSQSLTVAEIAKRAASPAVWASFFYELAQDEKMINVLEIGTNLGMSGQYFIKGLSGKPNSRFTTIEGVKKLCEIASNRFLKISSPSKFEVRHGLYDEQLTEIVKTSVKYNLVFIDGNHQYDATIKYFKILKNNFKENAIVIFDDIHWSHGMARAWEEITDQGGIVLSIDFFKLGIIVLDSNKPPKSAEKHQLFLKY